MKHKTLNLVLGAVALGLVAAVVVQQRKDEANLAEPPKKSEPLMTLVPADIGQVTLHHADAPDIRLERKDGRWSLTAPVQVAADAVEVGKLLAIANSEAQQPLDLTKINRADFGLEPPHATLTLNNTVLSFGEVETIRYLRYVEVDAGKPTDKLTLITDPDQAILDSNYTDLVSKSLLPANTELTRIELPGFAVARQGEAWTVTPADKDATQEDLDAFVDAWKRASAIRTEAPEAPKDGQSKGLTAKLTLADGTVRSYLIVNREPQLILDYAPIGVRYRLPPDISSRMIAIPKRKADVPAAGADAKPAAQPDVAPAAAETPKK